MEYRKLGRTGINVSCVGLGCEGFDGKSFDECEKMLDAAVKSGVSFFDMYTSNPQVRTNLGKALSKYPRDSFVVQGHLCSTWENGQYLRTRQIGKVKTAFEDLLAQMQLDYVDVGMIHYSDEVADYSSVMNGEVIEYAKRLKYEGKIRCIGISTHNTDVAVLAAKSGIIDVIMFSINPAYDMLPPCDDVNLLFEDGTFDRVYEGVDPKREALYSLCSSEGVALTVMKAFAGGLLLDGKQSPFGSAMTAVQCIAYCLDRPAVASVLSGAHSVEQINESVSYCTADDSAKDYGSILAGAPKSSFNGHCMYCGHCAPCAVRINVAEVNKLLDLAVSEGEVTETLREHYELLEHHASECIKCGSCMKNCPFNTDVIGKLQQASRLFGK